jgi:tetratricopeptide (TPR) repeat protein
MAFGARAETDPAALARAQEALPFAETLVQEKDYYRAITEYKRAAFLAPGTETSRQAGLGIGLSYRAGEKWEQAADAFRTLAVEAGTSVLGERAAWGLGETWRLAEEDAKARDAFLEFMRKFPSSRDADRVRLRLAACHARLQELKEAAETLDQVPETSPLKPEARKAREALVSPPDLRPKRPRLAGAMSAVLPGSGQWYSGRPGAGAGYFLLNLALIGGAAEAYQSDRDVLGTVLAAGALLAYSANIYGAVDDAHQANRESEERYLQGLERDLGLFPGNSLTGLRAPPSPGISVVWTWRF